MNVSNRGSNYHLHLNHLDLNFVSEIQHRSCRHGSLLETKEPADRDNINGETSFKNLNDYNTRNENVFSLNTLLSDHDIDVKNNKASDTLEHQGTGQCSSVSLAFIVLY